VSSQQCNLASLLQSEKTTTQTTFIDNKSTEEVVTLAIAFPGHTGFCRYGETCDGIVSGNLSEAQAICGHEPTDKDVLAVYQEQRDGRTKFVGYVCITPPAP
jgi:hypothetical protein